MFFGPWALAECGSVLRDDDQPAACEGKASSATGSGKDTR